MGMTPLEGVVMGTRSGDIDPGVLIELMRRESLDPDGLDVLLNRGAGLKGLSGLGNDMRDIEEKAAEGHEGCRLAIQVFAHRVRKYIGAYAAAMGGVDAIIFTAGIGENSALIRHRVSQRLDFLGAVLDDDLNRDATVSTAQPIRQFPRLTHGLGCWLSGPTKRDTSQNPPFESPSSRTESRRLPRFQSRSLPATSI